MDKIENHVNNAPFAFNGLDRIFHEKARLGILTSLAGQADGLSFNQLRELCGLTDGNLSRHMQVLEEAGVVALIKGFDGKRPLTMCSLTDAGRSGFLDYLAVLEQVLKGAAIAIAGPSTNNKSSRAFSQNEILSALKPI